MITSVNFRFDATGCHIECGSCEEYIVGVEVAPILSSETMSGVLTYLSSLHTCPHVEFDPQNPPYEVNDFLAWMKSQWPALSLESEYMVSKDNRQDAIDYAEAKGFVYAEREVDRILKAWPRATFSDMRVIIDFMTIILYFNHDPRDTDYVRTAIALYLFNQTNALND